MRPTHCLLLLAFVLCMPLAHAEQRVRVGAYHFPPYVVKPESTAPGGLLPELLAANIASVKIEGRQRSPAYVSQVAKVWRQAIDRCMADPQNYAPQAAWMETLGSMSEGTQTTLGAYHRKWQ